MSYSKMKKAELVSLCEKLTARNSLLDDQVKRLQDQGLGTTDERLKVAREAIVVLAENLFRMRKRVFYPKSPRPVNLQALRTYVLARLSKKENGNA